MMKRLALVCVVPFFVTVSSAQITIPHVPDWFTVFLWHLDESAPGTVNDAGQYFNSGVPRGTSVVPGRFGLARSFNGTSDYITLHEAGWQSPNFMATESFTMDCWFKTSSRADMVLIQRGLVNDPGYALRLNDGKPVGALRIRSNDAQHDTLLTIVGTTACNDGVWHHAMFIRDRPLKKLYLYVDGVLATEPVADALPYMVSTTRDLTVGRSADGSTPFSFDGVIDEVRLAQHARHPVLVTPLMGAWTFDSDTTDGAATDSSGNLNTGILTGTTLTEGVSGSARYFNGTSDYIWVNDPENNSLDFDTSQSFTVEAWFKTTSEEKMQVLRRGIYAHHPGFELYVNGGHVEASIGVDEYYSSPDSCLTLHSARHYNDDAWHRATLVRDRSARTLSLYVDGRLATMRLIDFIARPMSSTRPLTIGRWETSMPYFFRGALDRIAISRGALHPPGLHTPDLLVQGDARDFDTVVVGDMATRRILLYNAGDRDTLRVSEIRTKSPVFLAAETSLAIGPLDTASFTIRYQPTAAGLDSGMVRFSTNDTSQASVSIDLLGRAINAPRVTLLSPEYGASFTDAAVSFVWKKPHPSTVKYWFEWSWSYDFAHPNVDTSLTDTLLRRGEFPQRTSIYWRVRAKCSAAWGDYSDYRMFFQGTTAVEEHDGPQAYALLPNFPNPFNPSTTITFQIPEAARVRLDVFNAAGESVRIAAEGVYQPGEYRVRFDGAGLSSGIYFVRMRTGATTISRPILLLK
jgi:hypothetical protein